MTQTYESLAPIVPLPIASWRAITGYDLPGDYQMALDEALLESVIAGGVPVVRFYTWRPATLSLGVNQPFGEIDADECARRGFGLVRRLTGGRAVLHQHELTYSVIALENDSRVSGGVIESYRKISTALVEGLRSMGADVSLAEPSKAMFRALAESRRRTELDDTVDSSNGAVCFDTASAYELTARGRKLVGSAQARRGGAILQHGSILLDVDWDAWVNVFSYASEAGRERAYTKLPSRMTSLSEELGRPVTARELQAALVPAFERTFGISLMEAEPTPAEEEAARRLAAEKYATEGWTRKM
ncbi:MAG TPA: biotin/lipoate A/B protein ligase family protein [Chloroflexia bacterium]|nr:biotin/lipoate A/B protein ligase family protein [Chloroflexia bacterium]